MERRGDGAGEEDERTIRQAAGRRPAGPPARRGQGEHEGLDAAGVTWTLDDFERVRRRVPVVCDLKPSGRYHAVDLHRAGGVPQVMRVLLDAGVLDGGCLTITGRTVAETLADVPGAPRGDQDVIRPSSR